MQAPRGDRYACRTGPGGFAPRLVPAGETLQMTGLAAVVDGDAGPDRLAGRMAGIALRLVATDTPPPTPLYLRDADAAPPRDPPPVILP